MPAITVSQMLSAEQRALEQGWTEAALMQLAGEALGHAIGRYFPSPGTAVAYLGKGHNAGDTLIALRILQEQYGWTPYCRLAFPLKDSAPLMRDQAASFLAESFLPSPPHASHCKYPLLLLDGLIGTGGKGTLTPPLRSLAQEMATLRNECGATIAAIDIPSGINADDGSPSTAAVTADITWMIGNPKVGLLCDTATPYVGALALVPVPPLESHASSYMELIAPQTLPCSKAPRPHTLHKGKAGKVGIIAGSPAYTGAAVLAATGALRAGAGLVTLYVPPSIRPLVTAPCPSEIIIREYESFAKISAADADAWVVGCGLGELTPETADAYFAWLETHTHPTLLDADGLNAIAQYKRQNLLQSHHVLTPHPKEFQRLAPELSKLPREQAAQAFVERYPATLLLKGARSLVTQNGSPLWCNATGHAGMASAGMGDVLAGTIGSRLASGDPPVSAAALSAWLCGRAAECAVLKNRSLSAESLTASDIPQWIGAAYSDWRGATR